jgi:flagellar basal body-associated protein FliL
VLLVVLVILAAGIGGSSVFTGARWVPNLGGSDTGARLTRTTLIQTSTARRPRVKVKAAPVPAWLWIIIVVLIALAVIALLWRFWRGRRLPAAPSFQGASIQATHVVEPEPEPEPEKLLTGIELALQALDDQQREPADAVVRAWLGLQETAEESGIVRRPAETPTEFTSRILSGAFADDRALRTLLRLYLRTRFGDHPVTAADVAEVRDALRQLLSSWPAPAGAPPSGGRT